MKVDSNLIQGLLAGVPLAAVTGWFALRQIKIKADIKENSNELAKLQVASHERTVANRDKIDAESKRIDQATGLQQKILDRQDRQILKLEERLDTQSKRLDECLRDKASFYGELASVKVTLKEEQIYREKKEKEVDQLRDAYNSLIQGFSGKKTKKVNGTIKGSMTGDVEIEPKE